MAERYAVKNMFAPVAERIAPPVKATQPYGWRQRYRRDQRAQASVNTGEDTRRAAPPAPVVSAPALPQLGAQPVRAPAPAASAPALPPLGAPSTPTVAPRVSQYGGPPPAAAPQVLRTEPVVRDPRDVLAEAAAASAAKSAALDLAEQKLQQDYFDRMREAQTQASLSPAAHAANAAELAARSPAEAEAERLREERYRASQSSAPRVLQPQPVSAPAPAVSAPAPALDNMAAAEQARLAPAVPASPRRLSPEELRAQTQANEAIARTAGPGAMLWNAPVSTPLTQREQAAQQLQAGYNAARYGS